MSSSIRKKSDERARRDALIQQLEFYGQMQSTETAHFHQTAATKNGLNITDSKTISVLTQEGSMTAGQLATRLSLTTGAVTSVIDRLAAVGIVRRISDPSDRRKVIVQVNQKSIVRGSKVYDSIAQSFAELLEQYSDQQLEFLISFYQASIELTKQETKKLSR